MARGIEVKEYLWGYGSGVAAATVAGYGDVVLAEYTQPFNQTDVTYFRPLSQRTLVALSQFPTHITADAAFDAWYVYEAAARHGSIAAVPLNQHHPGLQRDPDGTPLCAKGLCMTPTFCYEHPYGYRARRFRCPLLFSGTQRADLRPRAICQRQGLPKGPQLGSRRSPARVAGSRQPALPRRVQPAHLL
jgi:hypothetical protein